jgi:hypothetical protein
MSERPSGVFYIPVQGSSEFAAHANQGSLIRLMWLLSFGQVAPEHIRALFAKVVTGDDWPLLEPRKGPLKIPEPYQDRYDMTVPDLRHLIACVVHEAVAVPDVGTIVLLYANHGHPDKSVARDYELKPGDFAEWAMTCIDHNKGLLVVLNACSSTAFAREAWDAVTRHVQKARPQALEFVKNNMGFITSGEGLCELSIPLISENESLVNLFGRKGELETWARGFYVRDSMFFRRFNWLLAYGFPPTATGPGGPKLTIGQFVDMMNDLPGLPRGFTAAWVGTEEASASLEFSSFVPVPPLGDLRAADEVPGWPEVRIGDVIHGRFGQLFDDVAQLRALELKARPEWKGETTERSGVPATAEIPQVVLLPIAAADGGGFACLGPLLSEDIDKENQFLYRLPSGLSEPGGEATAAAPERLQVLHLHLRAGRWAGKNKIRRCRAVVTVAICRSLEAHIEKTLKVAVPISQWGMVWKLAAFRGLFSSDETFELFLEELLRRSLYHWPEFQPLYPDVAPLRDDEELPLVQADLILVKERFIIDEVVDHTE